MYFILPRVVTVITDNLDVIDESIAKDLRLLTRILIKTVQRTAFRQLATLVDEDKQNQECYYSRK